MSVESKSLFSPYQLGEITLNNKFVMSPMTRSRANNITHVPNQISELYYEQRASAGLIITEGVVVNEKAIGSINIPGIYNDEQVNAWKKITDGVHRKGGKIFAQLWHVGRLSHPDLLGGELPVAPSAINPEFSVFTFGGMKDTVTPKELSVEEILQIEDDFKNAAVNAIKAGFDGVELHSANGYLFHQFFADSSNQRKDQYGGSVENKARFLFEVLDKIADAIGSDKIGIRLSPHTSYANIVADDEHKKVLDYIIERINDYPLAYLHLTGAGSGTQKEGAHPAEEIIKSTKYYRDLYKGTIIINNGFDKATAEKVLEEGIADLVAFGVPFLANPDLVKRYRNDYPLNTPDPATFYGSSGSQGYIDYPFYNNGI